MALDSIKLFISEALRHMAAGAKEDVMTNNFVSYLRQMFPDNPQWVSHYVSGIETSVSLYRRNSVTTGSIDVYIDGTVIEFEKNLTSQYSFTHGLDQVREYCASHIRIGANVSKMIGVLSDTLNWYFYSVQEVPGLANVELVLLNDIHISSADDNSAIELQNCLKEYLGREGARPLTADFLSEDFGIDSYWGNHYLQEAKVFIGSLAAQKPAYASLIHKIWSHFVEGIDLSIDASTGAYEYEFYIATLAKLLCANILAKRPILSGDDELIEIISGDYFQRLGYVNFVEYDYFGWINEHLSGSEYVQQLKNTQQNLAIYDYSSLPEEDIFGKLLSQLSIETKRVLLGQELTPQWLADEMVKKVASQLPQGRWPKFLDMCCGSGSMLISTICFCSDAFSKADLNDDEKYEIVSSAAMGIDIDPLAVILAKINWVIHTDSFCKNRTEIFIPVYHADSLSISSPVSSDPTAFTLNLDGNNVSLPRFLLNPENDGLFTVIIERVSQVINYLLTLNDFEIIVRDCVSTYGSIFEDEQISLIVTFAFDLYNVIRDLHLRDRNGIWAFLIKNSFKPALITRKFNGLVSNTPWMTLSEVKNNPYKKSLTQKANYYEINPTGSSFLHLELATVFLVHSIDSYLSDDGYYGCILPRSILKGKQHDKFRLASNFPSSYPFSVSHEELWDLPEDTFPNRAVALFGRKNSSSFFPFIGRKYEDKDSYEDTPVYRIHGAGRTIWALEPSGYNPIVPYYHFHQGADILPRSFFYFDMQVWGNNYKINTLKKNSSKYGFFLAAGQVTFDISSSIVPKFLFRKTVVSNVILPFIIADYPKALIPYKRDANTGKQTFFSIADFMSLPTPAVKVFRKTRNGYEQFKGAAVDLYGDKALNFRKKLTNQRFLLGKYLVVYGAGGSNVASAYFLLTEENVNIVIDQTLYYLLVDTEDEAIYLSGLLNSDVLSEAIITYQPSGRFRERHIHTLPQQFIPQYDSNNLVHKGFVDATKRLMEELMIKISSDGSLQQLLNPNYSVLSLRRRRLLNIIQSLDSFAEYDRCGRLILI